MLDIVFIVVVGETVHTVLQWTCWLLSSCRWLKIRLELIGNLTSVFAALFTIMADDLSASLAGLSVSYALQVSD